MLFALSIVCSGLVWLFLTEGCCQDQLSIHSIYFLLFIAVTRLYCVCSVNIRQCLL